MIRFFWLIFLYLFLSKFAIADFIQDPFYKNKSYNNFCVQDKEIQNYLNTNKFIGTFKKNKIYFALFKDEKNQINIYKQGSKLSPKELSIALIKENYISLESKQKNKCFSQKNIYLK